MENKKRGRKRKETETITPEVPILSDIENIQITVEEITPPLETADETYTNVTSETADAKNGAKKRGRKPKGGKLVIKQQDNPIQNNPVVNVILHLKCSMNDLNDYNNKLNKLVTNPLIYNPSVPPEILTYNDLYTNPFSTYDNTENNTNTIYTTYNEPQTNTDNTNLAYKDNYVSTTSNNTTNTPVLCINCSSDICNNPSTDKDDSNISSKEINAKLKNLKYNLYKNNLPDKKSACFWCTYDYDNAPCYIPKYEMDDRIFGYGSFCRPECAVAYLMKENIDDSTKFERYHLLNQIYSKVYDYKKSIKPAPNPYYLLEKFYFI